MEALEKLSHHTDWIFIILLLSALLFIAAKLSAPKRFNVFIGLPIHTKKFEFIEEFKPFQGLKRFETLLSINSYILIALGLFVLERAQSGNHPHFNGYLGFVRVLFFVSLFFVGKALINALLDWLYEHHGALSHTTTINLSYRIWMSFFLLPLIILVVFIPATSFYVAIVLAVFMLLAYLQSIIQSNLSLWKIAAPSYFKFLYICALEMMPIFFLVKWLV
jgi:MFS family permease